MQSSPGIYVGGSDAMVHTVPKWADTTANVTYLDHRSPGQPQGGPGKHCLGFLFDGNAGFGYQHFSCTDKLNFICETQ